MRKLVWDVEANGLLQDATAIHCIILKELGLDKFYRLWDNPCVLHRPEDKTITKDNLIEIFSQYDSIICHNQISYDIPLLKKLIGLDLYEHFDMEDIIDTYIISQVLNPDREMPRGCPTTITPPPHLRAKGFKSKKIGPHGLDSWGYRTGHKKVEIHDWSTFTPSILNRCKGDVIINELTYFELIKEGGLDV